MGKMVVTEFISLDGVFEDPGGVRGLTGLGLVDEYRLMVFPVILGTGKRLFDGAARTRLQLADVTSIGPDGVTIQRYTPAKA